MSFLYVFKFYKTNRARNMDQILNDMEVMWRATDKSDLDKFVSAFIEFDPAFVVGIGAGRMGYALQAFIMRLGHLGYHSSMLGDTNVQRIDQKSVAFVNSSSGETPSILLFAEQVKEAGGTLFVTSSKPASSIGRLADSLIVLPEIKSHQLMKSKFEQFSMLLYDHIAFQIFSRRDMVRSEVELNHSILE